MTQTRPPSPLMQASLLGKVEQVRQLIEAGAPLETRNNDGNTALWLACVGNHIGVMDLLIDAGSDVDSLNDSGATCLMYAASTGKAGVVERLLLANANTTLETLDGFTALDLAATVECLTLLRHWEKSTA